MTVRTLDHEARERLINELCELYPSYDEFDMFLSLRLDRRLATFSGRDALRLVVWRMVGAAEARGWIHDLIIKAAADSAHSTVLRELAAAPAPSPPPEAAIARDLEIVVIAPPRWEPLAAAVRADPRVRGVGWFSSADALRGGLGGADALVVSSEIMSAGERALVVSVAVVLLETGDAPSAGTTLAHVLSERVTQIVVPGEPGGTARRIVDHLAATVGASR